MKKSSLPIQKDGIRSICIKGKTKAEWLAIRSKTIGGSEMGSIMGVSGYGSAYSVYAERKGLVEPFTGNAMTELGTYLEDYVAKIFQERSGMKVNRTEYIWYNDRHPHLHASPDRLVIEKRKAVAGLEVKTTGSFSFSKVRGADFPIQYYTQCVQYMMVTELPVWYLIVYERGNCKDHIYMLTREAAVEKPSWVDGVCYVPQSDMDALQDAANEFWEALETNTPPAPDGTQEDADAIKMIYDEVKPGTADLWGCETLMQSYMEAKAEADAAKKAVDALAQQIQLRMDSMEKGECMGYKVTWKMQPGRASFDYKACIGANPDMERYLKVGAPYRKFEVKKV